jgi:hypothetical protein
MPMSTVPPSPPWPTSRPAVGGGERHPQVRGDDAAAAGRERPLEHDQAAPAAVAAERLAHRLGGERAEGGDAERADPQAVVAEFVDRVLDRAEHRAEGDNDQLGVIGAVGAHEPAAVAPRPRRRR